MLQMQSCLKLEPMSFILKRIVLACFSGIPNRQVFFTFKKIYKDYQYGYQMESL